MDENMTPANMEEQHIDHYEPLEEDSSRLLPREMDLFRDVPQPIRPEDIKLESIGIKESPSASRIRSPRKRKIRNEPDEPEISTRAAINLIATNPNVVRQVSIFKNRVSFY